MSGIVRNALRVCGMKNLVSTTTTVGIATNQVSRSVWHMSSRSSNKNSLGYNVEMLKPTHFCNNECRCLQHTKGKHFLYTNNVHILRKFNIVCHCTCFVKVNRV